MAFTGKSQGAATIMNFASIEHDPDELDTIDCDTRQHIYIWTNGLLGGKFLEKFSQILDLECQVLTRVDDYTYQNISLKITV